jgi:hypothetical protein
LRGAIQKSYGIAFLNIVYEQEFAGSISEGTDHENIQGIYVQACEMIWVNPGHSVVDGVLQDEEAGHSLIHAAVVLRH